MSESNKSTITTATTSTAVTIASSNNVTTPLESYTSSQEGVLKLRLFKKTSTNTLIDDPEATTSPVIDVEYESHFNITVPPSINLTLIYSSEPTTTSSKNLLICQFREIPFQEKERSMKMRKRRRRKKKPPLILRRRNRVVCH